MRYHNELKLELDYNEEAEEIVQSIAVVLIKPDHLDSNSNETVKEMVSEVFEDFRTAYGTEEKKIIIKMSIDEELNFTVEFEKKESDW